MDAVSNPAFKSWEVNDNAPRLQLELDAINPALQANELLHEAAYRRQGLGNSVYSPQYMV